MTRAAPKKTAATPAKKTTAKAPAKKAAPKATDTRPWAPVAGLEAVLAAVEETRHPSENLHNMCLRAVRQFWSLPMRFATAREAYEDAKKHGDIVKFTNVNDVPVGAPVFSRKRGADAKDPGHVFIACRWWHPQNGKPIRVFRSTDIKRSGEVDAVALQTLLDKWDHELLGYSKSLNGYRLSFKK